jgi:putative flippase GtrA
MRERLDRWKPTRKVTAHTAGTAFAFVVLVLFDDRLGLTPSESVAVAGALSSLFAYLVPERD